MTAPRERESRPRAGAATSANLPGGRLALIVAEAPTRVTAPASRRVLTQVAEVLVLVVEIDDEHSRRNVFLTLKSAERAARRATERGHGATVVLARLVPVRGGDDG